MKALRIAFLYHIIYILFCAQSNAQNIELNYIGKTETETAILDSINSPILFKDYNSMVTQIDSTLNRLQNTGYIESELANLNRENDSLFIAKIHLNKKYNSIYIYYPTEQINKELLSEVSDNITSDFFEIPISKTIATINFLNKKSSEKGQPFISFQIKNISKRNNASLKGDLVIISSKRRLINNIVVKGYEKFPKSFLKRYLRIRADQELNLTQIKAKTNTLNNLLFAAEIKDPEILFTKDSTEIYLYLEKSKSNTFDGFLGFGNNESTNKIEFDGYLNLNLINNLNFGESFNLIYKSDENEQRTFNISADLPYLLASPIGLNLNLNIFKKDSTFTVVNQTAKLFYSIDTKNKVYGGIDLIQSENLLDQSLSALSVEDYNSTFYAISFEHLNRNSNFLFPVQSYLFIEGGIGGRDIENVRQDQSTLKFKTFKIFKLNNKNSIYLNVNGDILFSDNFLTNELKRFGGINSIRGFEENSIFASLYSVLNSEYRYTVGQNIYIHSIVDAAYYKDDLNSVNEKLFGFGFGIGIATKSGLLKLNYANGLAENQPFKLSNSKIHISLNAFF